MYKRQVIDRSGSDDLKHGALLPRWGRDDLLPLWVADMDFEPPSFITDALKARLEHSLFGYTREPEDYLPSICLLYTSAAQNVWMLWGASLLIGACSVIPQFFIPIAGQFSEPKNKSRNIGLSLIHI